MLKRKKTAVIFIIILCCSFIVIGLYAFYQHQIQEENGAVTKEENTQVAEFSGEDVSISEYTGKDNNTGVKMNVLYDGYAKLEIPYPAKYNAEILSANKIRLTSEDKNTTIYIEQAGNTFGYTSENDIHSLSDFYNEFKYKLNSETFETEDETYYRYHSEPSEEIPEDALKDIRKDDEIRIVKQFPKLDMADSSGSFSNIAAFERRYYIRKSTDAGNADLVLTIVTFDSDSSSAKKIIDFMVSHLNHKDESFENTGTISLTSKTKLVLSKKFIYSHITNSNIDSSRGDPDAISYRIPAASLSSAAGTFIHIYKVASNFDLSEDYPGGFQELTLEYPEVTQAIDDLSYTADISKTDTSSVYNELKKKHSNFRDGIYTDIPIYRTANGGSALFENGADYSVEAFLVNSGDTARLITIGYFTTASKSIVRAIC